MVMKLQTKEIGMLTVGFVLFLIGLVFYAYEPAWIINPNGVGGGFIGAGVALMIITFREIRLRNKEIIIEDERIFRIAEKSSHKTLMILIILEGTLVALLGVTGYDIQAYSIMSLLFVITAILYVGFYFWYKRQM
ncbi:MAG: DUF2178 domain-containing protein [Halobacteriota archaeon]